MLRNIRGACVNELDRVGRIGLKNFGAYQDAAVREPVIITKNGRPRTVLIAYEDYLRMTRRDRRVELTVELGDAELAAVEGAVTDVGMDEFNAKLTSGNDAAR